MNQKQRMHAPCSFLSSKGRLSSLVILGSAVGIGAVLFSGCGAERSKISKTEKPLAAKRVAIPDNAPVKPATRGKVSVQVAPEPSKRVQQAPNTPPAQAIKRKPAVGQKSWGLLAKDSFVGIQVLKSTGEHYARFGEVSGQAVADAKDFVGVEVQVQTKSFEADVPAFAEHVRSSHFLDVKQFPEASFVSTSLRRDPGPLKHRYMLEGDLTLRGVTRRVTLSADLIRKASLMELQGRVPLNFKAFGMSQGEIANELIDGVELTLRLKFRLSK